MPHEPSNGSSPSAADPGPGGPPAPEAAKPAPRPTAPTAPPAPEPGVTGHQRGDRGPGSVRPTDRPTPERGSEVPRPAGRPGRREPPQSAPGRPPKHLPAGRGTPPEPRREASPARRAAFAVLIRVERASRRRGPPPRPDTLISRLVDRHGNPPSEADRAFARELVFGVLRFRRGLDYALDTYYRRPLSRLEPEVRTALRLGLYQLRYLDRVPTRAAVSEAVALASAASGRGAASLVNALLRTYLRADHPWPHPGGDPDLYLRVGLSHPDWLVDRAVARLGPEAARAALEANNRTPQSFLRVARNSDTDATRRRLEADGVETVPAPLAPRCLRVVRGNPTASAAYGEGAIHPQDAGSQLIAWLLPDGGRALELAAAPGGKATILAERWAPGRVVAADLRPARLRLLTETAARLGAENLLPLAAHAGKPPFLQGTFDRVLLDAPCTGLGTLARNPDIKWNSSPKRLRSLAKKQQFLAAAAARLVAPGGFLLYSVCSLEPEETEEVVAALREQAPEFHPADLRAPLPEQLHPLLDESGALRLPPGLHGTDGYYAALLRRHRL